MKKPLFVLALAFCSLVACSKESAAAGNNPPAGESALGKANRLLGGAVDLQKQTAAATQLTGVLGDLQKTLGGITDGATAQGAKATLDTLVDKVKAAVGDLGGIQKLLDGALGQAGASASGVVQSVLKQIDGLLANEQVKAAIGPVLDQLKGLLK